MIKFDFNKKNIFADEKNISTLDICQNILYYYNPNNLLLVEVNNDLEIIDTEHCFWKTIEYEVKIDVDSNNGLHIFELAMDTLSEIYSVSKISYQKSFETHYNIIKSNENMNIVVLGKKNWKKKKAIKIKSKYNDIGRIVSILPYTDDEFNVLTEDSISLIRYPSFYKSKYRYILVNKQKGTVYGVSYSVTNFLNKNIKNKIEIEVEYWSNIIQKDEKHCFDLENKYELYFIIEQIMDSLKTNNIKHVYPGVKKSDWLKEIFKR